MNHREFLDNAHKNANEKCFDCAEWYLNSDDDNGCYGMPESCHEFRPKRIEEGD